MEINVLLSHAQVERLIADPEVELVIYYPDGTKLIVRISDELVGESETVH